MMKMFTWTPVQCFINYILNFLIFFVFFCFPPTALPAADNDEDNDDDDDAADNDVILNEAEMEEVRRFLAELAERVPDVNPSPSFPNMEKVIDIKLLAETKVRMIIRLETLRRDYHLPRNCKWGVLWGRFFLLIVTIFPSLLS